MRCWANACPSYLIGDGLGGVSDDLGLDVHDGGGGGVGESRGVGVGESRGGGVGESRGAGVGHRMVKARVRQRRAGNSHQRQQSDEDLTEIKVIIYLWLWRPGHSKYQTNHSKNGQINIFSLLTWKWLSGTRNQIRAWAWR